MTSASLDAPPVTSIAERCLASTIFEWGNQRVDPLTITGAKGVHLYGEDGRRYLDFSSIAVNVNIGHGDPRVLDAVTDQLRRFEFISPMMASEIRAQVAERLFTVTPPGLQKAFFTLAGTDANEAAMRTARLVTGRAKILTRRRSYHGASMLALTASGDPRRHAVERGVADIVRIPDPYHYRFPWISDQHEFAEFNLAQIEEIIELEDPATIAAVMVEPITGSNGVIVPPPGWLRGLRELCDAYGLLLICDEVMSGFGRTGRWFACDHDGVSPDIMTIAKGITSGYVPLGACLLSGAIAEQVADVPFGSGLTYQSHPVALAAALANLEIYESDGLIERSAEMGEYLLAGLHALAERHPSVGDVRGRGLFAVLELVHDRETRDELFPIVGPTLPEAGAMRACLRDHNVIATLRGPYLMATPPLIVTPADIDEALAAFDAALDIADGATSAAGAPLPPHLARRRRRARPTPFASSPAT